RALAATAAAFGGGERDGGALEAAGHAVLAAEPAVRADYFAIVDPRSLERVRDADGASVALVAARVGSTRLIDNRILGSP
ncbi:MAG: pantoate--beta-alanine ligase, partial [Gemmatimonadaceae bacterium]